MKHVLRIAALSAMIPFLLLAGKGTKGTTSATLVATSCNIAPTDQCIMITGSGYGASKDVIIDVSGAGSGQYIAPANRQGNITVYIYDQTASGSYLVTATQTFKLMASTGFDIP